MKTPFRTSLPRLAAAACCLGLWSLVFAQESAADSDATEQAAAALEKVAVTGSRLRGLFDDSAWPLTLISRDELLATGRQRLGDILQELPFTSGSPLNTQTSQRGQGGDLSRGIETIELRGLGPERTLVLVNGRRFVPGGNGAGGLVDLGMLPVAMVQRIEIFKSGASVEYGADAVAGVINIITRDGFDGVELSAQGSVTRRNDAETFSLSGIAGKTFARGGFMAGLEYTDQPSVGKGERAFSRVRQSLEGPDNERVFDGSSAPPNGQFRTSMGRLTLIDGRDGDTPDDFRPFIDSGPDSDRFNFNPFEDLLQASERLTLFGHADYRLSDQVKLSAEALYHQRDSSQQLAPLPLFTTREQDLVVEAGNFFNPFGETLTDVRRRLVEAGPRTFSQDNDAWRLLLAADGRFGSWFWDLAVGRGRNETDQTKTGDLLDDRLRAALGPSFADPTSVRCGRPDAPVENCVPLNLFGGPGSITPEMLEFVGTTLQDRGFNEQTLVDANITGDIWMAPAGMVGLALGLQWREEKGADRPDPQTRAGNTTGNARSATSGSFDSTEAYVEIGVPLLAGKPWAQSLDLDLGGRLVDFSNFGIESVFELGLGWRPFDSLSFRGSYSEGFRAPNIGELFGGQAQSNPIVLDPCADFSVLDGREIQRCIDQGVPADGSFTQTGEETPELSGGNSALEPEQADILTIGMTWRPAALEGLSLGLDYYDIEIDNGIGSLGANTILEQCLATGAANFCEAIDRAADGTINFVEARLQNLATETARGVDLRLDWRHELEIGRLDHKVMLSRVEERSLTAFPGSAPLFGAGGFDQDNFGAIPEWRGVYGLDWTQADWSIGYQAHWIGPIRERGGEVFPGTVNRAGSVVYHDLHAAWQLQPGLQVSAGIDNLTDVDPPFLANADEANTDLATYRALGTAFWLRLGWQFSS
ncbi:MAG: TonB-dependent receptor [Wenzhouxiangellaceae bacterium]|nr:TonB-dependent receptor [Wenzhouxiangellaceae bacterium]